MLNKMKIGHLMATVAAFATTLLASGVAMAADEVGTDVAHNPNAGYIAIAIALGIGVAALGGAFGQSRAAAAALEGIARNPNASDKVFVPMILGMAFIESLVLFTWVLMFLLLNKI